MGFTKHTSILIALEIRALGYRSKSKGEIDTDKILYNESIDETGIVATTGLSDSDEDSWGEGNDYSLAAILERDEVAGIVEYLLEVHGVASDKKAERVTLLFYKDIGGIRNRICNNDKLDKAMEANIQTGSLCGGIQQS